MEMDSYGLGHDGTSPNGQPHAHAVIAHQHQHPYPHQHQHQHHQGDHQHVDLHYHQQRQHEQHHHPIRVHHQHGFHQASHAGPLDYSAGLPAGGGLDGTDTSQIFHNHPHSAHQAHSRHASVSSSHVDRPQYHHPQHHLQSSSSSPTSPSTFRHDVGLSVLTMAYGDAGSSFHPVATGGGLGGGASPALPQLRPKEANGSTPITPSGASHVRFDIRDRQDDRLRDEEDTDMLVDGLEEVSTHAQHDGDGPSTGGGHAANSGVKTSNYVVDPPNLAEWRQKLFDLEEMVVLTNTECETYFPHIDNVYSHRSTQRYKRKSFVSYYWDCRLKGRPPGTPKSTDPNKKKRKRQGRGLDLCDVKIKIVEYVVPGDDLPEEVAAVLAQQGSECGGKVWTIQRVCGFGPGDRKGGSTGGGTGTPAAHKHALERSDEIKKSSVARWVAAREKEAKKAAASVNTLGVKATGSAALTVKKRSKEGDLKLYAGCFCPFSQRVWIALEAKGLPYQYCETNPFKKPKPTHLLEANPRGLVPAIRQGEWACSESGVILEYLEELDSTVCLHPTNPRLKASCRLWIEIINNKIVPSFFALLAASEPGEAQSTAMERLQHDVATIVQAAEEKGPFFLGDQMCLVDIHFAPFALRMSRILEPLRGWVGLTRLAARWQIWVDAMERDVHVRSTVSADRLYLDTADLLVQGRQSEAEA